MNIALSVAYIIGVIAVLSASILLGRQERWRNGTTLMVVGAILFAVSLTKSAIALYQLFDLYGFEQRSETLWGIYDAVGLVTPVGILLFGLGFAKFTGLLAVVRGK